MIYYEKINPFKDYDRFQSFSKGPNFKLCVINFKSFRNFKNGCLRR